MHLQCNNGAPQNSYQMEKLGNMRICILECKSNQSIEYYLLNEKRDSVTNQEQEREGKI